MHQQTPRPERVTIKNIALFIGTDVHPVDHHLAILDDTERILCIDVTQTDRFDLCAAQLNTSFVFILHKIVVVCFAVGGNLFSWYPFHGAPPFSTVLTSASESGSHFLYILIITQFRPSEKEIFPVAFLEL